MLDYFYEGFTAAIGIAAAKLVMLVLFIIISLLAIGIYMLIKHLIVWPYKARRNGLNYHSIKSQVIERSQHPTDIFTLEVHILARGNLGIAYSRAMDMKTFNAFLLRKVYHDGIREGWLRKCTNGKVKYQYENTND
jgi:lipoprotein signal peptidase